MRLPDTSGPSRRAIGRPARRGCGTGDQPFAPDVDHHYVVARAVDSDVGAGADIGDVVAIGADPHVTGVGQRK
jgi:hypothetical protein